MVNFPDRPISKIGDILNLFEKDFLADVGVEWFRKIFKISPYGFVCGAL